MSAEEMGTADEGLASLPEEVWSAELARAHRDLSELDLRFREHALRTPELRRRSTFAKLVELQKVLGRKPQPWPAFVGPEKLAEFKRVSLAACNLLRSVVGRFYRFDPARAVAVYDLATAAQLDLLLSPPNGSDTALSRGDFIATPNGFQCIEFNFSANLGGWETVILAERLRALPSIAAFLAGQGEALSFTDTVEALFRHVLQTAVADGLCNGVLNVAFVLSQQGEDELGAMGSDLMNRTLQSASARLGAPLSTSVHFCRYKDLVSLRDRVYLGRTRIHSVVELDSRVTQAAVYRSFKRGGALIFNGPLSPLMTSKLTLGLAWELESAGLVSEAERRLLREHFPWTRQVVSGSVRFHDQEVAFADLLAQERDSLVLKRADSYGGKDVWMGRSSTAGEWEAASRRALAEGDWVAQEALEFVPYLFQCGEDGCAVHDVIWGPFFFGESYGGTVLRMQPRAQGGPVNLSRTATEGVVFEVQPRPDPGDGSPGKS
ncbi:MAG TPA: hypothetical protein VHQ90_16570 [Thermoanaerobaculia bacterium]|nr:hypothetical protein [Thermoanaerobaculia bacterium]